MVTALIVAVVTALATAVITRWLDDRRNDAAGERELAAELRTHLAAAHRCATKCVYAFERAWALQPQRDGQAAETHDAFDETAFCLALDQLDADIMELRGQKSEVIVRSDPTVERGPANDIETMLVVATELSRWLRYREVPADWGGDEQNFLLRSRDLIDTTPWMLAQSAAFRAAPTALTPGLRQIRRRNVELERRAARRQWRKVRINVVTGRARREQRRLEAHRAALQADSRGRREDG